MYMCVKGFIDGKGSRDAADALFTPALTADLAVDFVDSATDLALKGFKVHPTLNCLYTGTLCPLNCRNLSRTALG